MPVLPLRSQSLQALTCVPGRGRTDYRDSQCKGLLLEVRASGGRTWYLAYVNKRGQRRQLRLGDLRDLSLSQARTLADRHRSQVAMGEDPGEALSALKHVPTFSAFVEEQLVPHLKLTKRSWPCDLSILRCHLLPAFGGMNLDAISRADILAFQVRKLEEGLANGTVYRVMVLLRHALKLAIEWEVPGMASNPCSKVPLPKVSNERQRFLKPEEAQRLLVAVRASSNPHLEAIVTFLLLTGARKRECLDAKWEHIQGDQRRWFIPITKTGQPRHVALSDGALLLLRRQQLKTAESAWIFPNPATDKPFQSVYYAWDTARKEAGLADVRMHDLRHSFASFLINDGRTLYEVQQLLGHRNSAMTQRYAHLAHETLVDASNSASVAIASCMKPPV
jgi:integrase